MLLRSILFVPGIRQKMIDKAPGVPADAFCLDLEDSVPPAEKPEARQIVAANLGRPDFRSRGRIVRVNALSTGLIEQDLQAVVAPELQAISLPKVQDAKDVQQVSEMLAGFERARRIAEGQIKIIPWIELAIAVVNAYEIASADARVIGISFGAEDFAADMEVARTAEGREIVFPRAAVALAARAAGVTAIDTPEADFKDLAHLETESLRALSVGFQGKFCIHPSQVEIVNRLFSPNPVEVEYARRVIASYEEAERQGIGAVALDGKMIDAPVVARARQLLARAVALNV